MSRDDAKAQIKTAIAKARESASNLSSEQIDELVEEAVQAVRRENASTKST